MNTWAATESSTGLGTTSAEDDEGFYFRPQWQPVGAGNPAIRA
jgi:hypothetical protein